MKRFLPILIAIAIAAFFVWDYAGVKTDFAPHQGGYHYRQMIAGGGAPSPYCYRILVPMLSFGSAAFAYFWMMIGLALTGWGLFLLTKQLGGDDFAAWSAMILFLTWPDVSFVVMYWFSAGDPFAYAALVFAALCTLRRQTVLAICAVTVGVLSREIVLVALPFIWYASVHKKETTLLCLVPLIIWGAVIWNASPLPPVIGGEDNLSVFERFWSIRAIRAGGYFTSYSWLWKSFVVIGPLWFFGLQFLRDKRLLWFLVPALTIFISGDTVRMMLYAAPVIIPVAALGLAGLAPVRYRLPIAAIAIAANALRFTGNG